MDNDTLSVERTIAAPASAIFAYVSDAGKHQEIDGSGTVRGTRKPSQPLELGSVFGMAMHQGVGYPQEHRHRARARPPHRLEDHRARRARRRTHLALRAGAHR